MMASFFQPRRQAAAGGSAGPKRARELDHDEPDAHSAQRHQLAPAAQARQLARLKLSPKGYLAVHGILVDLGCGALVGLWPARVAPADARDLFEQLEREVPWAQRQVTVMGRTGDEPRKTAYFAADVERGTYTYSGLELRPLPFTPLLLRLKRVAEDVVRQAAEAAVKQGAPGAPPPPLAPVEFDSCLLNRYATGADCMGYHSDNEPLYGPNPTIVSLSFGAPRDFLLKRNTTGVKAQAILSEQQGRQRQGQEQGQQQGQQSQADLVKVELRSGDVLLMAGTSQDLWKHAVPRRTKDKQPTPGVRISLTFRRIVHPQAPRHQARAQQQGPGPGR